MSATPTTPVPAATVMVLREGALGLEVLLMRRHLNSGVLGGVHVFPGGKLDAADRRVEQTALDRPALDCWRDLAEPELDQASATGLYLAALRETYEECGLLLGQSQASDWAHQTADLRQLTRQGIGFHHALQRLGLRWPVSALLPWSRWVTPRITSVSNKRFDTRFFVASAPPAQSAVHDNHEATEAVWLSPRQALQRYWDSEMDLAPPQIISLGQLHRLGSMATVLVQARSQAPGLVAPEPFDEDGQRVICYPGDPQHSNPQAVWEGPTRLRYRNQRFEPEGGLAALLG